MSAYGEETCPAKDSVAIIRVFDQGIALNEKFKKSVSGEDQTAYRALRTQVQKLNDVKVIPCVQNARKTLSSRNEPKLAHKLLELVVSYENSSDETISYSLGLIFGANPSVLENVWTHFSMTERNFLWKQLHTGWLNARAKFNEEVIKDRERRLEQLRS